MIPKETLDLKIVDCYFGTGKNSKFINGVVIENKDKTIKSKASSGIDDKQRIILTDLYNKGELIGKICEIYYREISIKKTGEKSLRFPVFVKLRNDKIESD
jgi:ATP-dependent DNA ligase